MQENGDQHGTEGEEEDIGQLPKEEGHKPETEHDQGLADELRIPHQPSKGTVSIVHRLRLTRFVPTIQSKRGGVVPSILPDVVIQVFQATSSWPARNLPDAFPDDGNVL